MDSKLIFLCLIALLPAVLATVYPYNCTALCANITRDCNGSNTQFPTTTISPQVFCETACVTLNTTNSTAFNDDTYDCHYYHAGVAGSSPINANIHCVHAGPLGGGVCGTLAEAYCDFVLQTCTGANAQYVDVAPLGIKQICINAAEAFPVAMGGAIPLQWVGDATETSTAIECHQYHGLVAAQSSTNANIHCPHAGAYGGSVCGSPVENFCNFVESACGNTSYASYASQANCVLLAAAFPPQNGGLGNETSGNTLGCRAYHAAVAKSVPNPHCFHTAANGGAGVCGSTCDAYCSLIQYGCTGANQQHANLSACMTACALYPVVNYYNLTNSATAAPSANTLDCRYYHATAAILYSPTVHCPHAGVSGGGVCVSAVVSSSGGTSGGVGSSTGSSDAGSLKVTLGSFVAVVASVLLLL